MKKKFSTDKNDKNTFEIYQKVRDHCHYTEKFGGTVCSICNLRNKISKEISIVAHNPTDEHHFVIKQLAKEFDDQFECLRENRKKICHFSVSIKK